MDNVHESRPDGIGAGAPGIEITPAMIEAGIECYRAWELSHDYHGGYAALEPNVAELMRSLFPLLADVKKISKVGS